MRKLIKVESIGEYVKMPKSIKGLSLLAFKKKKPIKIKVKGGW